MFVTSSAIQNGAFEDKYGKRGTQFSPNGMPTYSIPFEIHDAPQGTKSFEMCIRDSVKPVRWAVQSGMTSVLMLMLSVWGSTITQ